MGESSWHRASASAAFMLLLASGPAIAQGLQDQIDTCAEIDDSKDRLACFDALVTVKDGNDDSAAADPVDVPTATPPPVAPSTKTETAQRSPPIIAPAPARDDDKDKDVFNVRLTRCTQTSASGRQVYYLDNGEVWRQSNSSRNNVRNCDTAVTIQKDVFGYKMLVPSENRSIRISPVR